MKRLLCVILTLVCVLAIASCDLLKKPEPSETVDTTTLAPTTTTPDATTPDATTPDATTPDTTTPEKTPEATTPEKAPDETTPENPPAEEVITVHIQFQSGGIHAVEEWIKVETPCTFNQVYSAFIKKHYLESSLLIPYLNGEVIDINETIYLQEGDYIYLKEYSGMPGDEPVCPHVWINGSCERCGAVCEHSEWDDNRQCLVCGSMLGVDLIYIEFYMDGEYCGCTSTIEYTVGEQLMFQFWRSWEDLTSTYDVYVGDVLVADQSYMIVESCNIYLVTRTYE